VSYEGDKSVRKGNIELLHGELERFVFLQGETTQVMFDRLMALDNHIRACRYFLMHTKIIRKRTELLL
jgi:hypothetical protein